MPLMQDSICITDSKMSPEGTGCLGKIVAKRKSEFCGLQVTYRLCEFCSDYTEEANGYSICATLIKTLKKSKSTVRETAFSSFVSSRHAAIEIFKMVSENEVTPCVLDYVVDDILNEYKALYIIKDADNVG